MKFIRTILVGLFIGVLLGLWMGVNLGQGKSLIEFPPSIGSDSGAA